MHSRDYRHIGRNIRRNVRDAVRSGNFEDIGQAVQDGVQEITDDVNGVLDSLRGESRRPYPPYGQGGPGNGDFGGYAYRDPVKRHSDFSNHMPGSISGLVCAIVGAVVGIPLLIVDIVTFAVGISGSIPYESFVGAISALTPITAASLGLMGWGVAARRRARRFARYRDALGGAAFSTVAKLADSTGESADRTKKDLRKMISSGACPQGHLDRGETCFMVDDETYDAYLEAEKSYAERAQTAQAEQKKVQADPKQAELDEVKKEGSECLRQIRAANDALPGKEISEKLDRLENVTARIFTCVAQHPEKLPDIHSFMRYYLPTTMKLVNAYQEFEAQPVQGENITKAKAEIMQALDTINTAFGNLLDSLFVDDALDVSTDISTLETLLRQGGLTGSDFAQAKENDKTSEITK